MIESSVQRTAYDNSDQLKGKTRNYTVDAFRLLGALSVVVLHTVEFRDFPPSIYFLLKNLTRWAVPFFFLVSGYYFEKAYKTQPEKSTLHRLKSLVGIFISSNLIYFIYNIYKGNLLSSTFSVHSLASGTYFHLWFIGSMIFGYLTVWFILSQASRKNLLLAIIGFFILFILGTGSYAQALGFNGISLEFARYLLSVPFLLIGYLCAKYKVVNIVSWPLAVILTVLGLGLQSVEAYFLYKILDLKIVGHDFLLGTLLFSIGVFCLSMKITTPKDNLITKLGREYSLLLYLYHPIFMLNGFTSFNFLTGDYLLSWVKPLGTFFICLVHVVILHKMIPLVYRFISGTLWK